MNTLVLGLAAPGSQTIRTETEGSGDPLILSTGLPDPSIDEYESWECGTSFAAPHVAGVAALLFSYAEDPIAIIDTTTYQLPLDPQDAWDIMVATADDLGDSYQFGAGRVNAYRALLKLRGQPSLPGDVKQDGEVNGSDVLFIRAFLDGVGPASDPECLMDVNADNVIDEQDWKNLLGYVNNGYPDLLVRATCFP